MKKLYKIKPKKEITVKTHMGKFELKYITEIDFSKDNIKKLENIKNFKDEKDKKGVYCFAYKEIILYIGKTDNTLYERMKQYLKGYTSQKTNYRIKNTLKNLKNILPQATSNTVDLYFISENILNYEMQDLKNNYKHWKNTEDKLDDKITKNNLQQKDNTQNNNKKEKNTINRFAEIIITGYCLNQNFLVK